MKIKLSLLAAAAVLATGGAAFAQDDSSPKLSFNVGAATDYVFRGVSQTDENPEIYGGADLTAGQFYAGVWASNVDFNDSTDAEVDLYAGVRPTLGPVSLDLGAIYYGYVNEPSAANWAYWEIKAAGSLPLGKATLGAAVYYSPDATGPTDESALYYEANAAVPLTDKISVSGALGRQTYEDSADYTTWNLGVGFALNDHIGLDVRYWDTDEHGFGDIYDSRVVAGIKATF